MYLRFAYRYLIQTFQKLFPTSPDMQTWI